MIKIENVEVFGWQAAIRGMRNPMNSWDKSDSGVQEIYGIGYEFVIGRNDLKLMKSLSNAGSDHAKFLRMINVTVDITAPLYWLKEFDTYKVGTVANSCSTMHKIHAKEFTMDDFSHEHLVPVNDKGEIDKDLIMPIKGSDANDSWGLLGQVIWYLNYWRGKFLETKDKKYWWQMIQMLPTSYNQKRTVQLNYQVLKSMYFARKNHKLDEWREFCDWILTLPYFKEIVLDE
jgi:hypothetical protein